MKPGPYLLALCAFAQETPAPPDTPPMAGPLQIAAPAVFEAGPFGKIGVNGILAGLGGWTTAAGNGGVAPDFGDAQIFVRKTEGWFQFYLQAGAYNFPTLGTPFVRTRQTMDDLYGPAPVAYVKIALDKNTSVLAGSLPTLIGAEYVFTFQNMNISRGLLLAQENTINRGVQIDRGMGEFKASLSWNDGFYSNRYSSVSGSLSYSHGPHGVTFLAMGNLRETAFRTVATPVQNNSSLYSAIYTWTKGKWTVEPYWQYTNVPTAPKAGIPKGASTHGGAILVSRAFRHGFSLPLRWEYLAGTGSAAQRSVNLMFGPGSQAFSATATPTFQRGGFFIRGDLAWVHAHRITPGCAFGPAGRRRDQPWALVEIGYFAGR